MKRPLSPALKGLITGLAMIGFAFLLYYLKTPGDSPYNISLMRFMQAAYCGRYWIFGSQLSSPANLASYSARDSVVLL